MPPKRITIRDHSAEANLFARRSVISLLIVLTCLSLLLSNLYYLQVTSYKDYQTRSNGNRIKVLPVAPNRGLIYDRNGVLLAENRPVYNLELIPEEISNLEETLDQLTSLLNITPAELKRFSKERRSQRRFKPVSLRNRLTPEEVAIFSVNQHLYPGVSVQARLTRHYPYADALTHVLGYVAKINKKDAQKLNEAGESANYAATHDIGKLGVEKFHESKLHGQVGHQEVEINNKGRIIRTLKFEEPVPGQDLVLNLDLEMQQIAKKAFEGYRGSVVVMDTRTGGILTLYSNPGYDPNLFVHGISSKNYSALLSSKHRPLINRATQGQYPPASTVKPHLAILGLNEGTITDKTRMYDRGSYQLKNVDHVWRDHNKWGHGWVDVTTAIEVSCDTFFYDLAYRLGIDKISGMMQKFGFGDYTGIDLYEESDANMPSRGWKRARFNQPWYIGDTIPVGIGQSYWTTTPLQLTQSIVTLANRGQRFVPQIIRGNLIDGKEVIDPVKTLEPVEVADEHWDTVLDSMYGVVNRPKGTGRAAFKNTYYVSAGKSGTAQLFSIGKDEKYEEKNVAEHLRDNAMYVGYAPYENPEIALTVVVENAGHGGQKAAPIARKIMDYYFDRYHPELKAQVAAQKEAEKKARLEEKNNAE